MIGRIATGLIIGILALALIGCGAQSRQRIVSPDAGATTPTEGDARFSQSGDFSNFRLLVSDEVNAIGDFNSLNVVISKIACPERRRVRRMDGDYSAGHLWRYRLRAGVAGPH